MISYTRFLTFSCDSIDSLIEITHYRVQIGNWGLLLSQKNGYFSVVCYQLRKHIFSGLIISLINLIIMQQSRMSRQSSEYSPSHPRKQEWSLIYKHRAMELEKAKSVQKLVSQQKKDHFKRQLDEQICSKNSAGQAEREEDKRYYQFIIKKAQEMKEKEERQKFEKYIQYKNMEQQNKKHFQYSNEAKKQTDGKVYNIEIGLKSQIDKKQRAEALRKDVVSTLDQQLSQKHQQQKRKKQQEIAEFYRNQQYQNQYQSNRINNNKKYEQNQTVYDYYRDLHNQKMRRDRDLQHKFVDQAIVKKDENQQRRREVENLKKEKNNIEMKDTLQKQLQLLNFKRSQELKTNPEQANYSFIKNIFREKKAPFDKKEYSQFLEKQAEEQRLTKLERRYMSEQQYRLNSNQLNKALNGAYTYDKYYDRSMGTLGDRSSLAKVNPLQGEDAELVKTKLDMLRTRRNRSMIHNDQSQGII